MDGMHDNHKRTSISQLLNPLGNNTNPDQSYSHPHPVQPPSLAPAMPVPPHPYPHPHQPHPAGYPQQHDPNASFHLRAANWDHVNEDQSGSKRKLDNPPRPYPLHPQMYHDATGTGDHAHRQARARMPEAPGYPMHSGVWPSHTEVTAMPYGSPVVAPMYSDERTALSGDYPLNPYNHTFHEQQGPSMHSQPPNASARGSIMDGPAGQNMQSNQPRFAVPTFYSPQAIPAFFYPAPAVSAPQKRPSTEVEDPPPQKGKKSRKKATADGTGTSKRGYNAKKRSEAAQIAAQNAQLVPNVSYAPISQDKGKEKASEASMRIVNTGNQPEGSEPTSQFQPELQFARCMSNRYRSEQFPRCVSCTRRWAGDTCRFQGIRYFLKDSSRNIVGISFVENQKPDMPNMNFPVKWNSPLEKQHIWRTKRTIAEALLPILHQELQHLAYPEIIRRTRESEVRATCDTCMTSIFSSSWMCRLCGREACAECFAQVRELTEDRPGATQQEIAALQHRRERHAHHNPFFLSCTRRNEHHAKDFSPMSRFHKEELADAIDRMEAIMKEPDVDALPSDNTVDASLEEPSQKLTEEGTLPSTLKPPNDKPLDIPSLPETSGGPLPPLEQPIAVPSNFAETAQAPETGPEESDSDLPSHETITLTDAELTEERFRSLWSEGHPLVVTGLLPKFKLSWDPDYFVHKYGSQSCLILECQTDVNKRITVGEFFSQFGKYEGRTECWKLKDWPPSTDFKSAFPELFEDFSNAVPVPNYVRRDGTLNIASHFPSNTVAPDLGPKMYNAMASFQAVGSKGSTRLHMDMADAVNIMTYAAATPDGKPGCAAWDLFQASDAEQLRKFLRNRYNGSYQHDPIHSQQFYLDRHLRQELHEKYGVKSHRIYQRPGEAVFIPAGCAHQVCNLSDCIKVAIDFVSSENIARCEKLTTEFREQNQSMAWKEDVLQLRTMMWFAWLSCCRQEEERKGMNDRSS